MAKRTRKAKALKTSEAYHHKTADALLRPDIGTQAQFRKKKPPAKYRFDPTLDPELSWDINVDRERAESLIADIEIAPTIDEARAAARELRKISQPFLNWAGKVEQSEIAVPTLPLFVHERLSTKAILESVRSRKRDKQHTLSLFADEELDITDRILKAYEHKAPWVNRLILGDSLVVMNSLLRYEGLGGQVQMIYIDPPYGVKFGSNFQPFVRKRDVKHSDDFTMTREPETVKAYRDTWELGLHSYLTYLRDRLLVCRELLSRSGSIFVQISDENMHHVREVMDEVFGSENFRSIIQFKKVSAMASQKLPTVCDYLLWYAKSTEHIRYQQLFMPREAGDPTAEEYMWLESPDGTTRRRMTKEEIENPASIPNGWRPFRPAPLTSQHYSPHRTVNHVFEGKTYHPGPNRQWSTTVPEGMDRLVAARRLTPRGNSLAFIRYLDDFPAVPLNNNWGDTSWGFAAQKEVVYAVQTHARVIQRCVLMTTAPGDLVLDPTCGGSTTAYVAEQWGRRWITIDCSRVPLALARQRLLTATFPYYELRDEGTGVSAGFKYERRKNSKGEEVGGIIPHITLKSIAQNEQPQEEILVDRSNVDNRIVRVSGPFTVEATIPIPADFDADGTEDSGAPSVEEHGDHIRRMLEALRKSPVLRLPGNQTVAFRSVRIPAATMVLHAEGEVASNGGAHPVAFVFGPADGAVSEQLVFQAAREANAKNYSHLYVIGFACQDAAAKLIANARQVAGIPATYVNATMDIQMGDLLKNTKSSQLFSVTGSPEVKLIRLKTKSSEHESLYQVELLGLDVYYPPGYDPTDASKDDVLHESGENVPAWFLDTDYNELCFYVSQAFFPRTEAWDNLKRALKGHYEDSVWEHLAGTVSEPFLAGENKRIAVKVIDDRGNELLVVKSLEEAEAKK